MKKYIRLSFLFLVLGIAAGVFYREFSKSLGVVNEHSTLGLVHTHLFVLGTIMVLLVGIAVIQFKKENSKIIKWAMLPYVTGVLGAASCMLARGVLEMLQKAGKMVISANTNTIISAVSGLFHALLGMGLVLIFIELLRSEKQEENKSTAS